MNWALLAGALIVAIFLASIMRQWDELDRATRSWSLALYSYLFVVLTLGVFLWR